MDRFRRAGQPPLAATLARETHADPQTRIQISFTYSDGFDREIQSKVQAEPGDAPQRDAVTGELLRDQDGAIVLANTLTRWVGTGRTIFNNKGKPVRQYEPFFSSTHLYEPERDLTDTGVSPVLFYDPVERVVATLHPNQTLREGRLRRLAPGHARRERYRHPGPAHRSGHRELRRRVLQDATG